MEMSDAPERIWTASTTGKCHVWFDTPSVNYRQEYIRADIHAAEISKLQARIDALVEAANRLDSVVDMPDQSDKVTRTYSYKWEMIDEAITAYRAAIAAAKGE